MSKTIKAYIITPRFKYDLEVLLPAIKEVCRKCDGSGKHVNPAVDGHGIFPEEFDPDFAEAYFSGVYDVKCEECHGERIVMVVDTDRLERENKKLLKAYYAAVEQQRRDEMESYHERRWGA
jgi:RecJ-like exonuclease